MIERPNFVYFSTYHSPLQHLDEKIATALWAAQKGIPVVPRRSHRDRIAHHLRQQPGYLPGISLEWVGNDLTLKAWRTGSDWRNPHDYGHVHSTPSIWLARDVL